VREPIHVCASPGELLPPTLRHVYVVCAGMDKKVGGLRRMIGREVDKGILSSSDESSSSGSGGGDGGNVARVLVFCYPQRPLERIAEILQHQLGKTIQNCDITTHVLRYDDTTTQRNTAMKEFMSKHAESPDRSDYSRTITTPSNNPRTVRIMVSTDVGARGLDIDGINLVVNYDLPSDTDMYVHRGGRAGRAGRKGVVMSLITDKEEFVLKRLGNKLGCDLDCIARQKDSKKKKVEMEEEVE